MNLRDWASNSEQVLDKIQGQDQSHTEKMKILGLSWIVRKDQMSINVSSTVDSQSNITKWTVLKQIASAFDPLGLFSPVILKGKFFIQTLWNQNISWDETLSLQDIIKWNDIQEELQRLLSSTFPRYIGVSQKEKRNCQLLAFCDASKHAYAASVYLYQKCGNMRRVDLVFSKTRLAPIKDISIPRLKLLAAVIGTRCLKFVQKEMKLNIDSKHIWLGSQCVLCWIDSKKPLKTFVENRVKEIKEQKDISFHYIPTKENPADIASRGTSTIELQRNKLWWNGPDWLIKPIEWPVWNFNKGNETLVSETESELKKSRVMYEAKLIAADGSSRENGEKNMPQTPCGINITALVLRFIAKLKKVKNGNDPLEASEILVAEQKWIEYTQSEHFNDIIISIKENKPNNSKNQLGLYLDGHGLLRCGGRLGNAEICERARHPLLLPKHSNLTDLIIENQHKKLYILE